MSHKRDETPVYSRDQGLDMRIEWSGADPIYMGKAKHGTADATAEWQICKMQWSSGNMTHLKWADGVDEFTKVWNDRATYSYGGI